MANKGERVISQVNFAQGVDATSQVFAQTPNTVPQIQGMVFTTNGALRTIDGTAEVLSCTDAGPTYPTILSNEAAPLPGFTQYMIRRETGIAAGTPTGLTLTSVNVAGGTLIPGTTYAYRVSAIDSIGETLACVEVTIVLAGGDNAVKLTWTYQGSPIGYNVYGRSSGTETQILPTGRYGGINDALFQSTTYSGSTTFIDDGNTAPNATSPPGANTTGVGLHFYIGLGNASTYTKALSFGTFPIDNFWSAAGRGVTPVGGYWSGSAALSNFTNATLSGGILGRSSSLPLQIPMLGNVVLALGNGAPPWYINLPPGGGGSVAPLGLGGSGTILPPANNVPPGMAHGAFINGFLWAWNTFPQDHSNGLDGPCALRQSNLNDPTIWNTANTTFIGKADGTEGTGIATFSIAETGIAPQTAVVIFKNQSAFLAPPLLISDANFSLQQAQTDQGCVAPRSIQFVPRIGVVRLTHLGISAFDGLRDNSISGPIHPYIFNDIPTASSSLAIDWSFAYLSKGFQTIKPLMYCLLAPGLSDYITYGYGAMTLLYCYDIERQAWSVVKLDTALGLVGFAATQFRGMTFTPTSIISGFSDGASHRWQCGDLTQEGGGAIPWSFISREIFGSQAAHQRVFAREVQIRGFGSGTISTITPTVNGGDNPDPHNPRNNTPTTYPLANAKRWTYTLDVGETVQDANVAVAGTGVVEIDSLEWLVVDKPVGVGPQIG